MVELHGPFTGGARGDRRASSRSRSCSRPGCSAAPTSSTAASATTSSTAARATTPSPARRRCASSTTSSRRSIPTRCATTRSTTKFADYDADDPWSKIAGFLLNFDAYRIDEATGQQLLVGGQLVKSEDGRDRIFGDHGNDWMVGGTDCDWLFGGFGDDLLQLDDNLETNGGLNDRPEDDERFRDGDFAFGGAGRDVLIANTAQDRMFDWHGEFNTYVVPFAPFGIPTVNRLFSPDARDLIRELAYAAGTDVTLIASEPYDEIALVEPEDRPLYQDQTGGPRDPQPGNIGGVQRDEVGGKNLHCSCDVLPLIHISKFLWTTDGSLQRVSSASGIGPVLAPGTGIYWTYEVTNVSAPTAAFPNVPLQITRILDDFGSPVNPADDFVPVYVSGDANANGLLDIGETWVYTSLGVVAYAVEPGLYTNTVTVEGRADNGGTTADVAENRHAGSGVEIEIFKAVNAVSELQPTLAEEADEPTGPVLAVGSTVKWTYRVINRTGTPIANVAVIDDNGTPGLAGDDFAPAYVSGDADGDGLLDPGEVWLYRAFGTAQLGAYENVGSVTGSQGSTLVAAEDTANYLGTTGIRIEKLANGDDADAAPGPFLPIGSPLVYTYRVHGDSAIPLTNVLVRDDNGTPGVLGDDWDASYVSGDVNGNGLLDFREVWLFTSQGVAGAPTTVPSGTTVNIATVTATNGGAPVSDSDVAHVTGEPTELTLVKAINAIDPAHPQDYEDADTAPGPYLVVGSTVVFTYAVSVGGLASARNVVVTDNKLGTIAAVTVIGGFNVGDVDRDGELDPGETWLFRATALAQLGLQTNLGTVTATDAVSGATLTRTDPANYTGTPTPLVTIVKAVNAVNPTSPTVAEDADDWRSPVYVRAGSAVTYTYIVRATLDVTGVIVRDDNGTPNDPSDDFLPTYISGDNNNNGVLDRNETWLYRATRAAVTGLFTNVARASVVRGGQTYHDDNPASTFGWVVDVDVQKATNAADPRDPSPVEDADAAPGMIVAVGAPVVWTYLVTNRGSVAVTPSLRDDHGTLELDDDFAPRLVDGDVNGNGKLDPGETWLYTSDGVAGYLAVEGQYGNVVTLTTTLPDGTTLTKRERSFHFGALAPLELVKSVNPVDPLAPTPYEDANFAPGVILPIGALVRWHYLLRNTGNFALDVVGIQDDGGVVGAVAFLADPVLDAQGFNLGDVDRDGLLDPGETWRYQSPDTHTVAFGQHTNTATAFAMFHGVSPAVQVTATDVANVWGSPTPGIAITKAVDGQPADTIADALYVRAGQTVTWTYRVTNTTTDTATPVSIGNVVVSDDAGTPGLLSDDFRPTFTGGDVNGNGLLDPGEVWTYSATGLIAAGLYGNVARVDGSRDGVLVRDDDVAYAFGSDPKVSLAKALNAVNPFAPTEIEDANAWAPQLFASGTVVFTYLLRNTGNIRVRMTGIVDDHGTPGVLGDDFAPVYVSGDTNNDGWLDLDEVWLFTSATFTVQPGAYTNTASVTVLEPRTDQTRTATDIARYFGTTRGEGNTPGFWKTNVETKVAAAWPRTLAGALVYDPLRTISSLFAGLPAELGDLTLDEGLGLGAARRPGAGPARDRRPAERHPSVRGLPALGPRGHRPHQRGDRVRERRDDRDAQGSLRRLQRARVRPRRERQPGPAAAVGDGRLDRRGPGRHEDGARHDLPVRAGDRPRQRQLGHRERHRNGGQRLRRRIRRRDVRDGRERQDRGDHDQRRYRLRGERDVRGAVERCRRRRDRHVRGHGHPDQRRRAGRAAAVGRRCSGDRGRQEHQHGDGHRAAVGGLRDAGHGHGLHGRRHRARRQRLPGRLGDAHLQPRRRRAQLPGQDRRRQGRGADRVADGRAVRSVRRHHRRRQRDRDDQRQRWRQPARGRDRPDGRRRLEPEPAASSSADRPWIKSATRKRTKRGCTHRRRRHALRCGKRWNLLRPAARLRLL